MIVVMGIIDNKRYEKAFDCIFDALEYRDYLDAHYAKKVEFIVDSNMRIFS